MPDGLKRYYGRGDLHFVTFSCYRRMDLLGTRRARHLFVEELARVRQERGFRLGRIRGDAEPRAPPNEEPARGTVSTALQLLKQRVSRKMRKRRRGGKGQLAFAFGGEEPRSFWQARFYDFNVCSRGKVKEKLHYMHANPVIRKLVEHPKEWPWSSWSECRKGERGLSEIDAVP